MTKGLKGFQKGHKGLVSAEGYKRVGEASAKRMQRIRDENGGKIPWLNGKGFQKGHGAFRTAEEYRNEETRRKLSEATTRQMSNLENRRFKEKNNKWKGEEASYEAFHIWLKTNFGKANKCEMPNCTYPRKNRAQKIIYKPSAFHWSKLKGKEHGHFRENYWMLCASCHMRYDGVRGRN